MMAERAVTSSNLTTGRPKWKEGIHKDQIEGGERAKGSNIAMAIA